MRFARLAPALGQDPASPRVRCHKQQRDGVSLGLERYDPDSMHRFVSAHDGRSGGGQHAL